MKNLQLQYYFTYKACKENIKHLPSSFTDRFWILKHKIISKMPSMLTSTFNRLRLHNIKHVTTRYYIRNYR